ncbi:MAG: tryptophan 2,3-dioxygenase [bacterium]|nr:tryptophan 2,3-dioxygenase [bacterium]
MSSAAGGKPLSYSSYLKIDELLDLQKPLSEGPEHDETLFIIIHQVYELWFKQINHEIDYARIMLEADRAEDALAVLKRILTILKIMVAQVDVLETMTPVSFSSFRARLESASGFQSAQFREFEFRLGLKKHAMVNHHPADSPGGKRLRKLVDEPTIYDSFLRFLAGRGYAIPEELSARDVREPIPESRALQDILVDIYQSDHLCSTLCERLVDLDEGVQEWRYRHVKMVERTIGTKPGTGGSEGADYLKTTLFQPLFPDLWAIRSRL